MNPILQAIEAEHLRKEPLVDFAPGDTIQVHTRIREGNRERVQIFSGTVIARNKGHGAINESFTVRRIVDGEGVERVFPVHSPKVEKVTVTRRGHVRRGKLYYLRNRVGKKTKVKERLSGKAEKAAAEAKAKAKPAETAKAEKAEQSAEAPAAGQ